MTIQDQLASALVSQGFKEIESASRKYRTFRPPTASGNLYFLGRNGALRYGRCASNSFAVSETGKQRLRDRAGVFAAADGVSHDD